MYRVESWVSWPCVCAQKTDRALPTCPQSANGAMIPVFDPPSTATRRGGLWGQVRCKQIQYTPHCMAPRGSQWSYSRGTNHFGSRFACFFLLHFPKAGGFLRRPSTQPPTAAIIYVYLHLDVSDWLNGPFSSDCTSAGLFSVQTRDHRAERERSTLSVP